MKEEKNTMYAQAMEIAGNTGLPFVAVYKRLQRGDTAEQAARPLYISKMMATGVMDNIVERIQWYMDNNYGQAPSISWIKEAANVNGRTSVRRYLSLLAKEGRLKKLDQLGKYIVVKQQKHEEPAPPTTETTTE